MNASSKPRAHAKAAQKHDAIAMLTADHKKVKGIFKQYEKLKAQDGSDEDKAALAQEVCNELKVHAQLEEEIFYPAAREAIDEDDLMDEAIVEHAGAKELIEQLEAMDPQDDLYDAKVTVLGELIDHHATEEEEEMFPKVVKAKVDTAALGEKMAERKMELMEDLDMPDKNSNGSRSPGEPRKTPDNKSPGQHDHR